MHVLDGGLCGIRLFGHGFCGVGMRMLRKWSPAVKVCSGWRDEGIGV